MGLKLFLDFDGTVTRTDVGNEFFRTFGGERCDELVSAYRAGKMSAQDCFRRELEAVGTADAAAIERFLSTQEVDEGFTGLMEFCREQTIPCTILSDGLDDYIHRILARAGEPVISFAANALTWEPDGPGRVRGKIDFPNSNAECDRCASCKRNIMLGMCGEEDVLAYVGDGYSDRCPVEYADIVFAKGELQTHCQQHNISYVAYRTLADVRSRLDALLRRRTLRRRPGAVQRRRDAYVAEA